MENHPIPQDITGFQFKLIGNMTIRQFVYLAIGAIIASLFFFIIPIPKFIGIIIAIISVSIGTAIAFVPIEGRPMDTMIINFIRAIFTPTRYIYGKTGGDISSNGFQVPIQPQPAPILTQATTTFQPTAQLQTPAIQAPDSTMLQNAFANNPIIPSPQTEPIPPVIPQDVEIPAATEQAPSAISEEPQNSIQNPPMESEKSPSEIRLEELMAQKQALEKELEAFRAQAQITPPIIEASAQNAPMTPLETAQLVPAANTPPATQMQAPASPTMIQSSNMFESPNLIKGIVKDPRGNPLINILVEVTDEEGNPARAFKTNAQGQFASATSLPNGKYVISLEDPKETNKFDTFNVEATGAPINPFEIISIDKREELRRELFN